MKLYFDYIEGYAIRHTRWVQGETTAPNASYSGKFGRKVDGERVRVIHPDVVLSSTQVMEVSWRRRRWRRGRAK